MPSRKPYVFVICVALMSSLVTINIAHAVSSAAFAVCAKRTAKAFKRFSIDAVKILGDCEVDSLKDDERNDCAVDEDVFDDLEDAADGVRREVRKCNDEALRALCPHGARDDDGLKAQVLSAPDGTTTRLMALDAELFTIEYAGCPRPLGEISRAAEDCADRITRAQDDALGELQKCQYKCELKKIGASGADPCLEENGDPFDPKVLGCIDRVLEDLNDDISNRCDTATLMEIGCPLHQSTVSDLASEMKERLFQETRAMSNDIFHSACGSSGGNNPEGGETDPIPVTLLPSVTQTQIDCGQVLDAAFFGADTELKLDADVDCSPAGRDTNAMVISASNVTINGRNDHDVTGPSRSSNRTGVGILIAPGAQNVRIKNIPRLQRYAIGIKDSGDNFGLVIENITVRRNKTAGVRTTSPDVLIDTVKADRNGIGFDVSGDGSTIQDSRALRSTPAPGIGMQLGGTDNDANGRVVRVNRSQANENVTGILINVGPQQLEDNDVRDNLAVGIVVASNGSKIESNSVKRNGDSGIVVSGSFNNITANSSDENLAFGYVVTGTGNDINNNGAGSLSDQGNLLDGFWIDGTATIVTDNDADANLGSGFVVDENTAVFDRNGAEGNAGVGFEINGTGNNLDTNIAADNGGFEFSIVAGNVDESGNRANGSTFSFSTGGGDFE